jgi:hypothetical protein
MKRSVQRAQNGLQTSGGTFRENEGSVRPKAAIWPEEMGLVERNRALGILRHPGKIYAMAGFFC